MTPEQALLLVTNIIKQVRLTWYDMDKVKKAIRVLEEVIKVDLEGDEDAKQ